MATNIVSKSEDYSRWYTDIIKAAELADDSPVRGCMVIRPNGYAIWEAIRDSLDKRIKETGHVNAYFPLFIPKSFLAKEAAHVEGFAMECAVVTHYGLKAVRDGEKVDVVVDEEKELEEPLIVRPTSETIINAMFSQWVQSYRDLPLLINQWANVVRWEMRTRKFLRTAEFLWQEGHTAHATAEEAEAEAQQMLNVYRSMMEEELALPVIIGAKSESERFAGAENTYALEAMMQDFKALQAGTSHNLGQNFAKAFDIQFQSTDGGLEYAWQTSWGVTTRLIGAVIMTHSDDNGLILPPRVSVTKAAIVPIYKSDEERAETIAFAQKVKEVLAEKGLQTVIDDREGIKPAQKYFHWEQRGIPLRLEVGPRDVKKRQAMSVRRHDRQKEAIHIDDIAERVPAILDEIQESLYARAKAMRDEHTYLCDSYDEFKERIEEGGFFLCHWDGTAETEAKVKEETKATIRCFPENLNEKKFPVKQKGKCMVTGKPSKQRVLLARAY